MDPELLQQRCDAVRGWPLPGGGDTLTRWRSLLAQARADLVLGRMVEAQADALAILAELGSIAATEGERWGVWAAGPPGAVTAQLARDGWTLSGSKPWCSGATLLTHALVGAQAPDGGRLFAVDLRQPSVRPGPVTWLGAGMAACDTRSVSFDDSPALPVGGPGDYLARPGFWIGAIGVAACWLGGADAVAAPLRARAAASDDPHLLAQLGAVHVTLAQAHALLELSATQIDAAPRGDHAVLARTVRSAVEGAATDVITRVGRALGPGPLATDGGHAALVADLTVYVRQHHAERDLEALGRDLAKADG